MDSTEQSKKDLLKPLDLDDLLPLVGEFGKYQKILLWFICLPACFPCGFCAFNQLFMADMPEHWCRVSALANLTQELRKELSIPSENGTYQSCKRYAVNWTEILDYDNLDVVSFNKKSLEDCLDGWEYNTTEISSSIIIDFDLVCDKDIYPTLALVALNLGGPIGVYFFGLLNDRIGRKKSFFACLSTMLTGSFLTASAQNFWWWAGSRVIVGLTIPALYQIPFIISLELVGPNYRSFVTVLTCVFYTLGLMMLAGITYLIRNWYYLTLATSTPFLLYYLYWFFLPESPRWLLAKGRFEEATRILEKLAKVNQKEFPSSFKQELKQRMMFKRTKSEDALLKKGPGVGSLCATPNMRLKTCLITFNWFANATVYVGLSYYGPALGNNPHLSFFLSSVVEIPSYLFCWVLMENWGRRWPLCLCMITSGLACIGTVMLPNDAVTATLCLFLLSKSGISASFLIIYPFAGELYPTQLRGLGIGLSSYVGGLGLIMIPFITYLGLDNLILPLIIMGILSVAGGLSGLRLPETLHHRLPQTIEEGEEFGKNFSMDDCCRCIPIKPTVTKEVAYEDLELDQFKSSVTEETPLETTALRKKSVHKLVRQGSFMDTQKDSDGSMKMTYWF